MNLDSLLGLTGPTITAASVVSVLRKGSPRALVLPAPTMLWQIMLTERTSTAPWYAIAVAHLAVLIVLIGCWRQNRAFAEWATVGCCASAAWLALG